MMNNDALGNLDDWSVVLEKIQGIRNEHKLDAYQPELLRMLRYQYNWKLCKTALAYIKELQNPDIDIVNEVWNIMMDNKVSYNQRMLAADCLGYLYGQHLDSQDKIISGMHRLLNTPLPAHFHNTLQQIVQQLKAT